MIPIQDLVTIDKGLIQPVYLQIANGMVGLIRQGILKPGTALPSSRNLAGVLDIHRNTVTAAYDELLAQSWVETLPRKGLFVAQNLPEVKPRQIRQMQLAGYPESTDYPVHDRTPSYAFEYPIATTREKLFLQDGLPDTRLAPVDLLIREYRRFAGYKFTTKFLSYGSAQGSEHLRTELSRFLNDTRGLHVSPDNILITRGSQMAIYLTAQVLLKPGDNVIVSEPGYLGASEVFDDAGAVLNFVPVDEEGMDTDRIEAICKRKKIRLLYVIPHHHSPTTVTLSSARRMQLLELARKYQFAILEDDYDFDFHYSCGPILPLASIDQCGSVIYVGSFCKTIAPAIRIGFMAAPVNLIRQVTGLRKIIDCQGEQLLEEAIANLLKNGDITRHLKKAGKIYHERRDLFCTLLEEHLGERISFKIPDGGFAIWASYTGRITAEAVTENARKLGIIIKGDPRGYYHQPQKEYTTVRLGFASMDVREMKEAVAIFAKAVR